MKFVYTEGATPFNQDDAAQLIPNHITTQSQLNEWEQVNILTAERWLFSQKRKNILSLSFLQKLHHRMFSKTWIWAGQFRTYQTNIGVPPYEITTNLTSLLQDVVFWMDHNIYPTDEIATRFHHRLVFIHAFPNGNGRHARLMTDVFLFFQNQPKFTWGQVSLINPSETRKNYIKALQSADSENFEPLLKFVRS